MKNFIKRNKLLLFISILLLILGLIGIIKYELEYKNLVTQYNEALEYYNSNEELYKELIANGYDFTPPYKADTLSLFIYIAWDSIVGLLDIIGPLIIIVVSGYEISNHLKSGYIKNALTRESYGKYILKIIGKSYLKSLIIPLFWLYFLFLCYLQSKTFNFNEGFGSTFVGDNAFKILFLYFIYVTIHSFFCANLSLIFNAKNKNFVINSIMAFIVFLISAYYFNTIFWYGIRTYLEINNRIIPSNLIYNFSLITHDFLQSSSGYLISFLVVIFCYLISLLGLISTYMYKEKVISENEN